MEKRQSIPSPSFSLSLLFFFFSVKIYINWVQVMIMGSKSFVVAQSIPLPLVIDVQDPSTRRLIGHFPAIRR